MGDKGFIREWEGFEIEVTIEMIFVLMKAVILGFLDKVSNLAVQGKDLNVTQNYEEWISISINSTTDPNIKLSYSTYSVIHYWIINKIKSNSVLFIGSSSNLTFCTSIALERIKHMLWITYLLGLKPIGTTSSSS